MEVKAYQCKHCGEIYKTNAKASKCEISCEEQRVEQERQKILQKEMQELVHYVRLNAQSVEDVCRMSEEVSKKLFGKYYIKKLILNVGYREHASNTHSAPIGMKSNFIASKNPDLPTGYPALTGEITIVYNKEPKGFSDEHFNRYNGIAGINTGSGGYRSSKEGYTCSYGVTLWLDDFPKIKENIEKVFLENNKFEEQQKQIVQEYEKELKKSTYIDGLDFDIKKLTKEVEELNARLQTVRQAKNDAIKEISTPFKEKIENLHTKTENGFRVSRPHKAL